MKHLLCSALLVVCLTNFAQANESKTLSNLHNARYCEIIVVNRHFYKMNASVYNSINLDSCPAALWNKLDVDAIKKQFDASVVKLNGPRYFVMDSMVASNTTLNQPSTIIGGIQFKKRAEITANIWDAPVGDKFYTPNKVMRYTVWVYNPGTTIYELISPQGNVYVMQSYSQIVDHNLQISDLPNLGQRLKLPAGWKYHTHTLTQPLELKADGIAYVINDDLYNSYQEVLGLTTVIH